MAKKNRVGGVAVDQLKSIIGRVEKLEEEKTDLEKQGCECTHSYKWQQWRQHQDAERHPA